MRKMTNKIRDLKNERTCLAKPTTLLLMRGSHLVILVVVSPPPLEVTSSRRLAWRHVARIRSTRRP